MIKEWEDEWEDMPEYAQEDKEPFKTIHVKFENSEDMLAFSELIQQKIMLQTKGIWYPAHKRKKARGIYVDES
jgi:hypothetical protein